MATVWRGKDTVKRYFVHSLTHSVNKLYRASSFPQVYLFLEEQMGPSNGPMNHLGPWQGVGSGGWGVGGPFLYTQFGGGG